MPLPFVRSVLDWRFAKPPSIRPPDIRVKDVKFENLLDICSRIDNLELLLSKFNNPVI